MTNYPSKIDTVTELPTVVDNTTLMSAADINRLRDAIIAAESELGVKPSGTYTTVRARLDALEGLLGHNVVITGINYTAKITDYAIIAHSVNNVILITLPTPVSVPDGKEIIIKSDGYGSTNNVSINPNSIVTTIDGQSTYTISTDYGFVKLLYSVTDNNWYIVARDYDSGIIIGGGGT